MAFLVIAGQTIPVWLNSGHRKETLIGEVRRAYSGAPRASIQGYETEWEGIETKWIARSTADTIRTALKGTPPLTVTGDLTGSITAFVLNIREVEKGRKMIGGASVEAVRLSLDLWVA